MDVRQIDPAELSPGEFASWIRCAVEQNGVKFIVIDSLNAFLQAMPGEKYLLLQMHEMLSYLNQQGVITILILGQHGIIGDVRSDVDLATCPIRSCYSVISRPREKCSRPCRSPKSRTTAHETSIREFRLGVGGIRIGEPLQGL